MKTLLIRAVSALVAVIMVCVFVYFGLEGLRMLTLLAVVLIAREGSRLLFPEVTSSMIKLLFALFTLAIYVFGVTHYEWIAVGYGITFVAFASLCLLLQKHFVDLEQVARTQARACVGFLYLALLPTFALKLLELKDGAVWFVALLAVVFAGDTMAYLVGWKFGENLLMPTVSPKKTIEGAFGGLLGSAIAGFVLHFFLPTIPLAGLLFLSVLSGMAGQMGDLFESMLKRVANQKDSGTLMPGHGGALDRIDGVLFAAPVLLAGASLLEKWF